MNAALSHELVVAIDEAAEETVRRFRFLAEILDEILTAHPEVDVVQLQINYLDWNGAVAQSGRCYETAKRHGKDVIVMEPVKGGQLAALPGKAMELFTAFSGTPRPRPPVSPSALPRPSARSRWCSAA